MQKEKKVVKIMEGVVEEGTDSNTLLLYNPMSPTHNTTQQSTTHNNTTQHNTAQHNTAHILQTNSWHTTVT